jgi:predicted HicB family RNase H-like nuclease
MKGSAARKPNPLSVQRPSAAAHKPGKTSSFEEEARLNVTLPVSLHAKVKIRAAEKHLSIRAYIIELLRANGVE